MKRDIYAELLQWKDLKNRQPLLIRGARQTGKTFIINELGKNEFKNFILINFERNPEYKEIFKTRIPAEIVERIVLFTGQKVEAGKSLLFIDEIQECPEAIVALRYFFEEMPELHIIGAGSLLEFALKSEDFRMPVGRVQYLYLYPLSFGEFLDATGETALRTYISDYAKLWNLPEGIHEKLTELVRKYYFIGGMPAVVNEYVTTGDIIKCQRIQRSIIDTYTDDFAKYSRISRHDLLRNILNSVPAMVGQKFVYSQIDKNTKSRDIKAALELLETAGILTRVRQTSGSGLPLSANVHESFFKIIFLDIGLFHAISGIYSETIRETDLTAIFKGAVAEQFAGQELVAYTSNYSRAGLYYWGRQEKNSTAEVDYLIEKYGKVIPVEIKSGPKGHLKSMHIFIEKYKSETALKISQARFESGNPIVSLPFYAIESFLKTGKTTK
jgi:predicted AAA+ superfamily ATPase